MIYNLVCGNCGAPFSAETVSALRAHAPVAVREMSVTVEQLAIKHLQTWGADPCHASMLAAFANQLLRAIPREQDAKPVENPDYASHGCKRAGGFVDTSCTAACDCHKTLAFAAPPSDSPGSA